MVELNEHENLVSGVEEGIHESNVSTPNSDQVTVETKEDGGIVHDGEDICIDGEDDCADLDPELIPGKHVRRKGVKGVREPKPETRCQCNALMTIWVDKLTNLWHVTKFVNDHSHDLLPTKYTRMFPAHRKISDADVLQMNNMRKAGITTP
ncbi:FAR1 DNA-binding domain [Sesbania bispinosa]|nr:FAR1 DNA-binding domain [Sesbania bispinosa]